MRIKDLFTYRFLVILIAVLFLCACSNKMEPQNMRNEDRIDNSMYNKFNEEKKEDEKNKKEERTVDKENNIIEQKIYDLFKETNARNENKIKIINLVQYMDWMIYNEVSENGALELINWLNNLEIRDVEDIKKVLNATKKLDGVYAEEYSNLVGNLYLNNKLLFVKSLAKLQPVQVELICSYVSYHCSYYEIGEIKKETMELLNESDITVNEKEVINQLLKAFEASQKEDIKD